MRGGVHVDEPEPASHHGIADLTDRQGPRHLTGPPHAKQLVSPVELVDRGDTVDAVDPVDNVIVWVYRTGPTAPVIVSRSPSGLRHERPLRCRPTT